jgi:hypothetical protein
MKIVKINKTYRSGNIEHFLVLLEEPYSNDDIDYLVEEWCDEDLSGSNYGYSYEWTFVEDNDLKNKVLQGKIKILNNKIQECQEMINQISNQL